MNHRLPLLPHAPVRSSNIESIGYAEDQHHLQVEFSNGATYDYLGVPQTVVDQLRLSRSKGSYLREAIVPRFKSVKRK